MQHMPGSGNERRAYKFAQNLRHVGIVQLEVFKVAGFHQLAGVTEVGEVVLRQVLHLYQPAGPAAGTLGSAEL